MTALGGDIVVASGNPGKVAELARIFADLPLTLRPQSEFALRPVPETGLTFVENALLKARAAARQSGLAALADDSGLAVDALGGAPGIHSARYAGGAGDAANNDKLLHELADVPAPARGARFICVLVLLRHAEDPVPLIAEGQWHGSILTAPRGSGGFGYDPLFEVPGRGLSAAELPAGEKNRISHRGQAAAKLRELVRES